MSKYAKIIIPLIVLVLFFSLWSYNIFRGPQNSLLEEEYEQPKINISSLPYRVQDSLKGLKKRVENENRFVLNFDRLLAREIITSSSTLVLKVGEGEEKFNSYLLSMPDTFVGITVNELKDKLKDWKFEDYQPHNSLVISRVFSGQEDFPFYLGIKDDRVAVLEKKDVVDDEVLELTDLYLEQLPVEERKALEKGIKVGSEEELLTILEGLLSYRLD